MQSVNELSTVKGMAIERMAWARHLGQVATVRASLGLAKLHM